MTTEKGKFTLLQAERSSSNGSVTPSKVLLEDDFKITSVVML